jgi:hypothetical protein
MLNRSKQQMIHLRRLRRSRRSSLRRGKKHGARKLSRKMTKMKKSTLALFGDRAASEFDTVEPAVFAPTVNVYAAKDFGAAVAGFVELPSPQLNTSALFGGSVAPASSDFFSTLVPPVDASAQQQAQDPFAQTDVQHQQHHDSVWTPADVQQNEAYVQEQTPNVLPPNDLFGAASAAQQDPFAHRHSIGTCKRTHRQSRTPRCSVRRPCWVLKRVRRSSRSRSSLRVRPTAS